ncbi:MAG: hypothetical protein Q7S09_04475 [bacterium]|nr:hypothetical protein [bacterium]
MTEQKSAATSIVIGGESYRGGMLYWGVIAMVVVVFLVTTITYWLDTLRVIDENTLGAIEIKRSRDFPRSGSN